MTTVQSRERLVTWLQDADAMEQEAETLSISKASRVAHDLELKLRAEQHMQKTQQQSASVQQCWDLVGGGVPALKGMLGSVTVGMRAAGKALMTDEVAKGVSISDAFEHLEIPTHRALVVATRVASQTQVAQNCKNILQQQYRDGRITPRASGSNHARVSRTPITVRRHRQAVNRIVSTL
ncbi:DUF892 family protein [Xanthomonas fragariae]|uniref:DUF892 family protein n=1 Tax=Xanthomonas fragariae TaxID=48664 RepID=UPI001EDED8F0|nr:DUF892 family protein [Xanthomonas fragariae]